VARSTLALPFSGVMAEEQVDLVCDRLRRAVEHARARRALRP